uniref:Uncharacterized protein n=1 Tax=Avena sativa TaxID=4498 RepID=A0ACD6AFF4_AVESA
MTRCRDCTRAAPLKRLVTIKEDSGNFGREFVKCEIKAELGKNLKKCNHFEWIDQYVERLQGEGITDLRGYATREINQAPAVEKFSTGDGELIGELNKLNKHLRQMVCLKKQAVVINATFVISLRSVYLQLISR